MRTAEPLDGTRSSGPLKFSKRSKWFSGVQQPRNNSQELHETFKECPRDNGYSEEDVPHAVHECDFFLSERAAALQQFSAGTLVSLVGGLMRLVASPKTLGHYVGLLVGSAATASASDGGCGNAWAGDACG